MGLVDGKVVLVTGAGGGIGRAEALLFAREGAKVVVNDVGGARDGTGSGDAAAAKVAEEIKASGGAAVANYDSVASPEGVARLMKTAIDAFGRIDVVVNNAAEQHPQDTLTEISDAQLESTFRTNVFGMFYLTRAALPHLRAGGTIINTTSVVAYRGSPHLIDYAATKGAIVAFTRSMAQSVAERGIRVNAVAPGPIWTPLIAASFDAEHVATFGADTLMRRAGEPAEVAPCFVFLACDDSSYMTGQVLHPNGGDTMSG